MQRSISDASINLNLNYKIYIVFDIIYMIDKSDIFFRNKFYMFIDIEEKL
jgi:hypothetical protein